VKPTQSRLSANPAPNLAPFGRWTLRRGRRGHPLTVPVIGANKNLRAPRIPFPAGTQGVRPCLLPQKAIPTSFPAERIWPDGRVRNWRK
jgi:hypothetical protein